MQVTAGVALSALSAVVSLVIAEFVRRKDAPGALGVAAFSAAAAVWAGGNAVQLAATTLDVKLLAVDLQYVGIVVIPVAWFVFAAEYTGREEWVNRRTIGALAVFPVALLALVATNDLHHLVRSSAALERSQGVVRLTREFGPLFWVAIAYSNVVNAAGTVMLLQNALRVGAQYQRQTVAVLVGVSVPWVANVAYLGGSTVVEPEAFFGVTALAFGYAVTHHDLFELVPVARNRVFAGLDDGVVVVDRDGRVADHNAAAARLFAGDLSVGDPATDAVPAGVWEARNDDHDDPVAVGGGDDGTRWVTARSDPLREDAPGEVVVFRDVTELERNRRELERHNERLEHVADTISHDLRNPLNVARGHLELAEETGGRTHFEHVEGALDRMDGVIDGTLRLARTGIGSPEASDVSLAEAARRAWQNVPTDGAALDLDCGGAVVRADPAQLESVLENLFQNSVEHAGGDVTVTVTSVDGGFTVADDGPGVPAEDRDAVFDRGYSTNENGTGFGLAIVRDVADAHGWTVSLGASEDGGVFVEVAGVTRDDARVENR